MYQPTIISPSILSADFASLGEEVAAVSRAGADWIHFDVMDGHFVPNLTVGVPVLKSLRAITNKPLDVHLMVANPLDQVPWFLECGPDYVTLHWEALDEGRQAAQAKEICECIRDAGAHPGIALKPDTPIAVLEDTLALWDMVLVMSVYPGFSGQFFIPESAERVHFLRDMCQAQEVAPLIQVDGGIAADTAPLVAEFGADVLVAGNAVFKAADYGVAISRIRSFADAAHEEGLRG